MYETLLAIHNIMRWVVIVLGALAVVRAFIGWSGKHAWIPADRKIGSFFAVALDLQLLAGLVLYLVYSPVGLAAFRNMDMASIMGQSEIRFFAVEHAIFMLLAVVFVHMGNVLARKAEKPADKHRRAAIWLGLALLVILLGTPWARALFPVF